MEFILQSKYFGINLELDQIEYIGTLQCFGDYNTTLVFDIEKLYFDDSDSEYKKSKMNKELDFFFKKSYTTFLWIRTNSKYIYQSLADEYFFESFFESSNELEISISESELCKKTSEILPKIKIEYIYFNDDNSFSISFSHDDYYLTTHFDKQKKVTY